MMKYLFSAAATLTVLAGPAFATETIESELMAAESGVTAAQAGRIVLQGGQAIGTLAEVSEADNLAVIALMDGSEKQVALGDLMITDDGSIELVAMAGTSNGATYE
ncbi:MAG: hypothetical protein ACFBZ9_06215 [Sphingomonadales bacterium]